MIIILKKSTDLTRDRITSNQASLSGGDRLSQDVKMIGVYLMQMTGILADLLTKDHLLETSTAVRKEKTKMESRPNKVDETWSYWVF
jgi:hypothetical protein